MHMSKSSLNLDENELDKLVLSEFNKAEKETIRRRPKPKEKIWEEIDKSGKKLDVDTSKDRSELLNEEEEKFVSNVVEWLRAKNNKDAIMDRIWNLLTDSKPESFYSPVSEEEQEQVQVKDPEPKDAGGEAESMQN